MPRLHELPDEVVLGIVGHLRKVEDLKTLQLVCRRFYGLARDGGVWRSLCFESSVAGQRHNRATIPKPIPPRPVQVLQAEAAGLQSLREGPGDGNSSNTARDVRERALASWDPRFDGEPVDWFREYVARQAPLSLRWARGADRQVEDDIEGLGLYRDSQGGKRAFLRFEDGRVGLWDIGDSRSSPGRVHRSGAEVLRGGYPSTYENIAADRLSMSSSQITDCVSIDRARDKAYVAVDCQLNEIDLHTLQQSSCVSLPRPISALSNASSSSPLIVGTSTGLYRHDPRHSSRWFDGDQVLFHQHSLGHPADAPAPHLSLSIVQAQSLNFGRSGPSEIYAAGRYPSILVYDQRTFPKIRQSIWSGANLSSLSLIPHMLRQIKSESSGSAINGRETSQEQQQQQIPLSRGHTILAGGAKNGKGSLELYGIDCEPEGGGSSSFPSTAAEVGNIRNRTQASRVKLLSVAPHGKRIVTSDADGNIKWFERDGFSLVRQVNTNDLPSATTAAAAARGRKTPSLSSSPSSSSSSSSSSSPSSSPRSAGGGIFGTRQDNGDVVRKLVPVDRAEDAPILLWAGGRAGLLRFGQGDDDDDQQQPDGQVDIDEDTAKARRYEERMRRLLEVHAMEARRMQDFGM